MFHLFIYSSIYVHAHVSICLPIFTSVAFKMHLYIILLFTCSLFYFLVAFAVNLDIFLKDTSLLLNPKGTPGYLESDLLSKIITRPELEARANDCTQVRNVYI